MSNNDSFEQYDRWKKKEDGVWSKISRNIKPFWVIGFFVLIFFGNWLVTSGQISFGFFVLLIVGVAISLLFMIFREQPMTKIIPEHILKTMAKELFEIKRREGIEVPFDSTIRINPLVNPVYENDLASGTSGIIKLEVGVEVIIKNRLKKNYLVSFHPYTGEVLGIMPVTLGLNKNSISKDRVIIPVNVLPENKKKE